MPFKSRARVSFPASLLTGAAADALSQRNQNAINDTGIAFGTVLSHIPGSRSYMVVPDGTNDQIKVASRQLKEVAGVRTSQKKPEDSSNSYNDNTEGGSDSDDDSGGDGENSETRNQAAYSLSSVTDKDWTFCNSLLDDPLYKDYPNFQMNKKGRILLDDGVDGKKCLPYFLAFFPLREMHACYPEIREMTQDKQWHGVPAITDGVFLGFVAIIILMSLVELAARPMYWDLENELIKAALFNEIMPFHAFEKLLALIWQVLPKHEVGENMSDGRVCEENDRLKSVRKWFDIVQAHMRSNFVAGSVLVPDETMIQWTGPGPHLTHMPRKPVPLGVMLKTVCDAGTRVLLSMEFVEEASLQADKKWARSKGKSTACTLRITAPWHSGSPRVVAADSWFGSLCTAYWLRAMGLFSVMVVKNGTKGFPKNALLQKVQREGEFERNQRAYAIIDINVEGHKKRLQAAVHVDKQPMVLVATCGTSQDAEEITRHRSYYDPDAGAVVKWTGQLQQPQIHELYRSNFNAVDLFNRLAFGPGSIGTGISTKSFELRLFLSTLAMAETNAYLAYISKNDIRCEDMPHREFKYKLAMECINRLREERGSTQSAAARRTSGSSRGSVAAPSPDATNNAKPFKRGSWQKEALPAIWQGHLLCSAGKRHPNCEMCNKRTGFTCGCGRAICRPTEHSSCYAGHLHQVMTGGCPTVAAKRPRGAAM